MAILPWIQPVGKLAVHPDLYSYSSTHPAQGYAWCCGVASVQFLPLTNFYTGLVLMERA